MAMLRNSRKRHTVRRLMIAPGIWALVTALSSTTYAQDGRSELSPEQVDEGQVNLNAPIEGTWIQKILPAGAPAPFIALVSFAAGGVTEATGTADRNSPFASPAAPQSILIGSWRSHNNTTGPASPGAERATTRVYVSTLPFFSFDTEGNALNMYKNYITYWLTDYNNLKGMGNSVKCDIDGTHCAPYGSITISGTRLIAQGASN
jgi:hypothetical protein